MKNKQQKGFKDAPQETTRLLLDSSRIAHETEAIGERTAEEMRFQREKLEETGQQLESIKQITDSAKASIRELQQKIFRKKLYLWVIIIGLLLANLAVIMALIQNHGRLFPTYA